MENVTESYEPKDFSPDDLVEFFTATGVSPECSECKKGVTAIQAGSAGQVRLAFNEFLEFNKGNAARVPGLLHPSVMTICNNCGYIRNFSAHRVITWLDARHPERKKNK